MSVDCAGKNLEKDRLKMPQTARPSRLQPIAEGRLRQRAKKVCHCPRKRLRACLPQWQGLGRDGDKMKDSEFKPIIDEIKRQYDLQMKMDDSHDTKIGIMLGFILIVLAQITLSETFLNEIIKNQISLIIFTVGLLSILCATYFGIRAYFIRKYNVGPKIFDLVEQYRKGEKRDYNKVISRKIYDAFVENTSISQNKANRIKKMFVSFFVGFVLITVSKIISMVI